MKEEIGCVYDEIFPLEVAKIPLDPLPKLHTQILMLLGSNEDALSLSAMPLDGAGLTEVEFIIADHFQAHLM